MNGQRLGVVVSASLVAVLWACDGEQGGPDQHDAKPVGTDGGALQGGRDAGSATSLAPGAKLARFESDAAFQRYLKRLEEQQPTARRRRGGLFGGEQPPMPAAESAAELPAAPEAHLPTRNLETWRPCFGPSITVSPPAVSVASPKLIVRSSKLSNSSA